MTTPVTDHGLYGVIGLWRDWKMFTADSVALLTFEYDFI